MKRGAAPYAERLPRPELRAHLACVWVERARPDGASFRDRVLPDAWVDVIWGRRLWVRGPDTRSHEVSYGPQRAFVGLRVRRGAAVAVLGVPASDLLDRRVSIGALWGRAGAELEERVAAAPVDAAAELLQDAVTQRLRSALSPDAAVAVAAARLEAGATATVKQLAGDLGLSERQLLRRCRASLGYGPKTLQRILRLQRLRRLALLERSAELPRLALLAGYADQAHMARDCRLLAEDTPSRLVAGLRVRFVQDGGLVEP